MYFSAKQISEFLGGDIIGNPNVEVSNFARIEFGIPGTITFLADPKYTNFIYETGSDIILVNDDIILDKPVKATLIKVKNAYTALTSLLKFVNDNNPPKTGIEPMSFVSQTSSLGDNIYIGSFAYISDNSSIGNNTQLYPHVYVGDNVKIGNNTIIYSGVKIYKDSIIGDNCIIHSGAVIGSDGFGFNNNDGIYDKIPQLGNVVIENNCEIGANTTIDRAVIGSTIIQNGVKLDNLIQIAHNCNIGSNTAMAAQVGVAGSTKIGERCLLGGQAGLGGHISIGNDVKIGAQSGIISNIEDKSEIIGSPAMPIKTFFRTNVVLPKLSEMYRQLNIIEKELQDIKKKMQE